MSPSKVHCSIKWSFGIIFGHHIYKRRFSWFCNLCRFGFAASVGSWSHTNQNFTRRVPSYHSYHLSLIFPTWFTLTWGTRMERFEGFECWTFRILGRELINPIINHITESCSENFAVEFDPKIGSLFSLPFNFSFPYLLSGCPKTCIFCSVSYKKSN